MGAIRFGDFYEGDWPTLTSPADGSADGLAGTVAPNGKEIWDLEQIVANLNRTADKWDVSDGKITYGFYDTPRTTGLYNNPKEGFGISEGYSPFNAEQRAAARDAIQYWDDFLAVDFVEKNGQGAADIRFMNTTTGPAQAAAYLPFGDTYGSKYQKIQGDVFVNNAQPSNLQLFEGGYGLTTLIHEAGHAIGLSHPGAYNFGPGFSVSYANGAEYFQDSEQYSIMSYWGGNNTGAAHIDWYNLAFINGSTPMVHDIAAAQAMYGADMTTRTGDTVYGFNSTADRKALDFTNNKLPLVSIWDAGGHDTLDLSGFGSRSKIDLNEGAFSSGGGRDELPDLAYMQENFFGPGYTQAQLDSLYARYGATDGLLTDNISIAYGAVIEDGKTGAGDDSLFGNQVANRLAAGAGDDELNGRAGADRLAGEEGADRFVFTNLEKGDIVEDFDVAEGDTLDFNNVDVAGTDMAFRFIGTGDFSNSAGELRAVAGTAVLDGKTVAATLLEGDADGDGVADLSVALIGQHDLTADAFGLIS